MDIWTLIERNYRPGANATARELVKVCGALNVKTDEDLANPKKVNARALSRHKPSTPALKLARALLVINGLDDRHLD